MATCPGGLILHADDSILGCTLDYDEEAAAAASSDTKATPVAAGSGPSMAATTAESSYPLDRAE